RDLQNLDASVLYIAQEPCTVGARRLNADAPELPEGSHPGQHLLVAVPGRRKTSAFQHPVELIDDGSEREDLCGYRRHRRRQGRPAQDHLAGPLLLSLWWTRPPPRIGRRSCRACSSASSTKWA